MFTLLTLLAQASSAPVALPPIAPPPSTPAPAVSARGDVRAIFTADDYPSAAVALKQEGDVQARLTVGIDGRPTGCEVVASSGSSALDSGTCAILMTRARFTPARDSSGQPVIDHYITPKIRWRLPEAELAMPTSLFSSADYPKAAVLLGQEGSVQAVLTIGADGKASDCTIVESSGYSALDSATCQILTARGLFNVAQDSQGRPKTDTVLTPMITWRLEGNELPRESWTMRLLVALDDKGIPRMCAIRSGGSLKNLAQLTLPCSDLSGAFTVPPELASQFAGRKTTLIFDQQFVPKSVNSIDSPRDLKKYPLLSREVLRFSVEARGTVAGCRRSTTEGTYTPPIDGCDAMRGRRFRPDKKAGTTVTPATVTTAIYAYTK